MSYFDHSLTYRDRALKNIGHRARLSDQLQIVRGLNLQKNATFADFGCSDGFITNKIAEILESGDVVGFDHNQDNLAVGRERHRAIDFHTIDLNRDASPGQWDLCTCFETLEHLGNLENAIATVLGSARKVAFISVPIEVGLYGGLKFLAKMAYGYDVKELTGQTRLSYAKALLSNERISQLRDASRPAWATHFGFDYRDVDDIVLAHQPDAKIWSQRGNRFYLIR